MARPIRLLYIIPDGFPTIWPAVTILFGKYLSKVGIASDLVTHQSDAFQNTDEWPAGRLFLARRPRSLVLQRVFVLVNELRALLAMRRGEYDGIQVRDKALITVFALIQSRRLNIPFFYWMGFPVHDAALRMARTNGMKLGIARYLFLLVRGYVGAFILRRTLPFASHIFVQSEKMMESVAQMGIPQQRMTPVPVCIDPEYFTGNLPEPVLDARLSGRRIVAYLGACDRIRRIDFLFESAAIVRQTHPDLMLLIIGDAQEKIDREWLKERVADLGVQDFVLITGWLPRSKAEAYLATAEIALSYVPRDPLLDVGTPIKLSEYLAWGKPVVANDHPDQAAIIKASGAGLCVPTDPRLYAEAINILLDTPGLASNMGKAGRPYIFRERSYPMMVETVARQYRKCVDEIDK